MIKIRIVLYAVTFDKIHGEYKILSSEANNFIECTSDIIENIDYNYQLDTLFSKYFDFSIEDVKKIHLDPIIVDGILSLPVLCLIPYIESVREGYLIPAKENVQHISSLRKILALF